MLNKSAYTGPADLCLLPQPFYAPRHYSVPERVSSMTSLVAGSELVSLVHGFISAKKQQGAFSIDLTVRGISRVKSGGSLDFGGSEYKEASVETLDPVKETPDEPYGWWNLSPGKYLIRYNETLAHREKTLIMILPHERLLAAGGSHPPLVVQNLDEGICVTLEVGQEGLAIKENARVSKALAFT